MGITPEQEKIIKAVKCLISREASSEYPHLFIGEDSIFILGPEFNINYPLTKIKILDSETTHTSFWTSKVTKTRIYQAEVFFHSPYDSEHPNASRLTYDTIITDPRTIEELRSYISKQKTIEDNRLALVERKLEIEKKLYLEKLSNCGE